MVVIDEKYEGIISEDTYIALGSFDGLHIGHLTLINKAIELADKFNGKSMVFSFKNYPLSFIRPESAPKLLMNKDEKLSVLEKLGIDICCLIDFNENVMKMQPEDFVELLSKKYKAKGIIVGFNHKFGYKNKGDINLLKSLEAVYGYKVYVLDAYSYGEEVVSSSRIREEISNGDLEEANRMLSREYFLEGKVIHGKKLGRQLGFPTANLEYNSNYVLPKTGVYYTNVLVNNEIYKGITSVGYNPTVSGDKKLTVETYILDFSEEIYDLQMKVYFIKRIRDEEKFNSMEELINQLKDDRNFALNEEIKISF